MDAADEAQDLADQIEELKRKHQIKPTLDAEPTGYCLNCGNPDILKGTRWCDKDCRQDWERRQNK